VSAERGELIATNESTVIAEPLLDAIMVEDRQSNGCFPDPPCADESDWSEIFGETKNPLDQFVPSEAGPRRLRRQFSKNAMKMLDREPHAIRDC